MRSRRRLVSVAVLLVVALFGCSANSSGRAADSGSGSRSNQRSRELIPVIDAGDRTTCVVVKTGAVTCWGDNENHELGKGTKRSYSNKPVEVGVADATSVSVGYDEACALLDDGGVRCWGITLRSDDGSYEGYAIDPVKIRGLSGATDLAVSDSHACAIVGRGEIACWGEASQKDFSVDDKSGKRARAAATTAKRLTGIRDAKSISGGGHFCAVVGTGKVLCWHHEVENFPGHGNTPDSDKPLEVTGITNAKAVATGSDTSCALLATGTVSCWGDNEHGELGNDTATPTGTPDQDPDQDPGLADPTASAIMPVQVPGITHATAIAVGPDHACAIVEHGLVKCWGDNSHGQLGNGVTGNSGTKGEVVSTGLTNATSVTATEEHSCAILVGGTVKCWGENIDGQLGTGRGDLRSPTPVTVALGG